MSYWVWIPLEILLYSLIALITQLNNRQSSRKLNALLIMFSFFPLWALIAPHSDNLAFDGLLYDALMIMTMTLTLCLMGAGKRFSRLNWIGAVCAVFGFILLKA